MADFCIAAAQGALLIGTFTQDSQRVMSAIRVALDCIDPAAETPRNFRPDRESQLSTPPTLDPVIDADRDTSQIADFGQDEPDARLKMITIAAELFHKQGVSATSPADIIEVARTGKGQFYYYFKSKQGLVHEVLQGRLKEITTNCSHINYHIRSWEDLEQWFWRNIDLQKQFEMARSCPLGAIAHETTRSDTLLEQDVRLIYEVIHNKLAAFFIREKARGVLSEDRNEDALADFCMATLQGAMLLGKVRRDAHVAETVIGRALSYVEPREASSGRLKIRGDDSPCRDKWVEFDQEGGCL